MLPTTEIAHPCKKGQALTQALVGIGLLSIMSMGFASMMVQQQKETKALTEKLGALDLEKLLIASLADGTICTKELTTTPNILNPADLAATNISLPGIHASAAAGAPLLVTAGSMAPALLTSLKLESISVMHIISAPGGIPHYYLGDLMVTFKNDTLIRPLKPLVIKTKIMTDAANKIISCAASEGSNPTPPLFPCNDPGKILHWSNTLGWSCDALSGGGGSPIPTPLQCSDSTKILHWNGSAWTCDIASGGGGSSQPTQAGMPCNSLFANTWTPLPGIAVPGITLYRLNAEPFCCHIKDLYNGSLYITEDTAYLGCVRL